MKLSEFKTLTRGYIPGAKAQIITDPVLTSLINKGVIDIAAYTACLKANKKFNLTTNSEYVLSDVIEDYLTPDKPGLWINRGTVAIPDWKKLNPRTLAWLDENRPNWRNLAAGTPQDYSIDGDTLTLVPAADTALANGLWLYYGKTPTDMSDESSYPFTGSTTVQLTRLLPFDDAILTYVAWKVNPILNKDQTLDITEAQYKRAREEALNIFKKRPDISADKNARFQGPRVGR